MAKVFICYRRGSFTDAVGRIHDQLTKDECSVFTDEDIREGGLWDKIIETRLQTAELVLVVIGTDWLSCSSSDGRRRIDDENDWVRREVKTALESQKTIIPILVGGAEMPSEDQLPDDIKKLVRHQGRHITKHNFRRDLETLSNVICRPPLPCQPPLPKANFVLASKSPRRKALL